MNEVCNIVRKCEQKLDSGLCGLGIMCQTIVEQCNGCKRVQGEYCSAFPTPATRWRIAQNCSMATHVVSEAKEEEKINPLKQSKQAMRAKKK